MVPSTGDPLSGDPKGTWLKQRYVWSSLSQVEAPGRLLSKEPCESAVGEEREPSGRERTKLRVEDVTLK